MLTRRSLKWPITLGVVMFLLLAALIVFWVIGNYSAAMESQNAGLYWAILAVGATFLVLVTVGVVLYLLLSIKAIRLNQRQSNFIDSVTHELKSPIASLKLCLQTLDRRPVTPDQQTEFHRIMLTDLERLDHLIDHLLEAARLDQRPTAVETEEVNLAALLRTCAATTCQRHHVPEETILLDLEPAIVEARLADLEMVFRNLLDNAVKYAGPEPKVQVELHNGRGKVTAAISDNGPGIPAKLRRKIFGRFVRLGNELERSRTGTGLGLFIVRTLVTGMPGRVTVHGRGSQQGTTFTVELPAADPQG